MKILVTGGSGFLGRYLVEALLKAGHTSIRIFNRSGCSCFQTPNVEVVRGDLANYTAVNNACKGCDAVFHVAAKAGVWGSYHAYYRPNVIGTENVIKACKTNGIKYLIYTSSPSVVYKGQDLTNADERTSYGTRTHMGHYAYTKMLAEQKVLAANGEELATIALRPHLIFGPGDNHLIPTLLQVAKKHKLRQVGDGNNWVDLSYVSDVAHAHVLALKALQTNAYCVAGKAYFISSGDPVKLWSWIQQLLQRLQLPPARTPALSPKMAYILGACLEVIYKVLWIKATPPMTRFVAKELSQNHYFDISAAKMDLHYIPQVSIEEGTDRLIEWLKTRCK